MIETFIYGNKVDENLCDDLISFFNKNEAFHFEGIVLNKKRGAIVDKNSKESIDMSFDPKNCNVYPIDKYLNELNGVIEKFKVRYNISPEFDAFNILETFNIQKYVPGGGFKTWHSERTNIKSVNRQFAFMTYLNTVENGGTEFLYQNMKMNAVKGVTLIWPSDWTHTHRGIIANKEKYIITGWLGYKQNE